MIPARTLTLLFALLMTASSWAQTMTLDHTVYYLNAIMRDYTVTKNISVEDSISVKAPYTLSYQVDVDEQYNIQVKVIKDFSELLSINTADPHDLQVEQVFKTEANDAIILNCKGWTQCIRKEIPAQMLSYYTASLRMEIKEGAIQAKNIRDAFMYLVMKADEYKAMQANR